MTFVIWVLHDIVLELTVRRSVMKRTIIAVLCLLVVGSTGCNNQSTQRTASQPSQPTTEPESQSAKVQPVAEVDATLLNQKQKLRRRMNLRLRHQRNPDNL
jgi:hypothetical protein